MTSITFVRHGNTDYNRERRAQGHLQNPLNDLGRKQAGLVASRLKEEQWDVLISSDLQRAKETAEIISREISLPIASFDKRIREIDKGQMTDTTEDERIAKWGADWHTLDLGEESDQSLRARGVEFIADIASLYQGKKILVVSHGYFMLQMMREILQDETLIEMDNTAVSTILNKEGKWECSLYNCTRHLAKEDMVPGQSDVPSSSN